MTFEIFNKAIASVMITVQNSVMSAVKSLKANTFNAKITNIPNVQKVVGRVFIVNEKPVDVSDKKTQSSLDSVLSAIKSIKIPGSIKVDNFPAYQKFPEFPKKIEISNFPSPKDFPKEISISNHPTEQLENIVIKMGEVKKSVENLKLNPIIKVESPKQDKIVVPAPHVSVTQQEIDYEKLAKALAQEIPTIDYKRLAEALAKEVSPISVSSGGGGKYAFKDSSGRGTTGRVDGDGHVQVDVQTMPAISIDQPDNYPLPDAQVATLTPPAAITGFATSAKQDGVIGELQTLNSLTPNKYDNVVITYTDSTKKTIDSPAWTEPILTVTWTEPVGGATFTQKVVMF